MDSRKAFEAWYNKEHPGTQAGYAFSYSEAQNEYTDGYAQMLWEAWQAALAQQAAESAEPVYQLCNDTTGIEKWYDVSKATYDLHKDKPWPAAARILFTAPQPAVPEGWRIEDEPEHSMMTVYAPNGKAALLRDFDGSVGGMFLGFIRDLLAAAPEAPNG